MKFIVILLFGLCLAFQLPLSAQYNIPSSVLGNGGSPMCSSNYQINGTLGQCLIGIYSGTSDKLYAGFWNTLKSIITGINDEPGMNLSYDYHLGQNFPNPFNSRTTIVYEMPHDSYINLSIFNVLGEHVVTLVNEKKQAGQYTVEWDASNFLSGTYFCRLITGNNSETSVLQLLR